MVEAVIAGTSFGGVEILRRAVWSRPGQQGSTTDGSKAAENFSRHMDEMPISLPPYCDVPVLVEIEHIERAFNHSFDAADGEALEIDVLADVPPADWPTMCLGFHASPCLLSNRDNSFAIWRALANDQVPPEEVVDPVTRLVWCRDLVSRYGALSEAEACALKNGHLRGRFR